VTDAEIGRQGRFEVRLKCGDVFLLVATGKRKRTARFSEAIDQISDRDRSDLEAHDDRDIEATARRS
jgi:hypothetical protein